MPYRSLSHPPISLWGHQAAVKQLREAGRAQVDEDALFRMVDQMRTITEEAAKTTRRARRDTQRRPNPGTTCGACGGRAATRPGWRDRGAVRRDRAVVTMAGEEIADLSHLHPSARPVALLPDEQRRRHVRADRWIGYTRASEAIEKLEESFGWPDKQRMPNLLLIGPTKQRQVDDHQEVPADAPGRVGARP